MFKKQYLCKQMFRKNLYWKDMETKIRNCETRQFKVVFPNTLNTNDTLFGGEAMKWMDEVAFITATRFTKQKVCTVNTERINFLKTIYPNSIVEVVGQVISFDLVRLTIKVEVFAERMYSNENHKCIEGNFVFAAIDSKNRPIRLDL